MSCLRMEALWRTHDKPAPDGAGMSAARRPAGRSLPGSDLPDGARHGRTPPATGNCLSRPRRQRHVRITDPQIHPGLPKTIMALPSAGQPGHPFPASPFCRDRHASTIVRELAVRRPPGGLSVRDSATESGPYGKDCFLFGRRSCGYLDVRTHDGTRPSACSCRKDTASSGTEQHLSHRT